MKKLFAFALAAALALSLAACRGSGEAEEATTPTSTGQNKIRQIDEQLQGTWIDAETDNLVIKWTFNDGNYVIDIYVNGERRDNHMTGTYAIGAETIETVHSNGVKGAIPYSIIDGILSLGEDDDPMYKEET